jgi:elongator complex protein 1
MKNLILLGEQRRSVALAEGSSQARHIVDICQVLDDDGDSESARIILTNDGIVARVLDTGEVSWVCNLEEIKPGGGWFDLSYVDPDLVCLSKSGAIVTVSPTTGEAELVGVFDLGLEAAAWSPDREVLLMVTSTPCEENEAETNSVLLTMNAQWEVLAEVTIEKYVSSKDADDAKISATWRPDGSLFALSTVDASDETRKVRIYKRDTLELHAIGRSEDASGKIVNNLGDAKLAWASVGCSQLLAAVQRKGKKTIQVIFFESNGLRHREFVLDEPGTSSVLGLAWNVDSDLLAVSLREEAGTDKVQLWHRSNYHWYLKQEFRYPEQAIECTKFDEEKPSKLYVLLRGLDWREYDVRWDPSSTLTSSIGCSAYAVDGFTLNSTPLDKALVPPPMYLSNVKMNFPISHVSFCHDESLWAAVLVALSDGSLVALGRDGVENQSLPMKVRWDETESVDPMTLRCFLVVGGDNSHLRVIAVACANTNGKCEQLVELVISCDDKQDARAKVTKTFTLEDQLLRMVNWSDVSTGALLQLMDGTLLEYEIHEGGSSLLSSQAEPLLEPCPWIAALKDMSSFDDNDHLQRHSRLVFGLSAKSRLYCHDLLLTDSASSFFLSTAHQFLCYATAGSRCQLRFLPMVEVYNFDPLMGSDQNQFLEGYESRNVERGARLVAILPSQPTAVLQMPRGNLEGVSPRALVLRYVLTKITSGEYMDAFRMMRRQKVDLNILVDVNPWHFLDEGVSTFLEQVEVIDHLNLFISCLQNWDITKSRFPVPHWLSHNTLQTEGQKEFDFTTKVNQVCRKARSIMLQSETEGCMPGGRKVEIGHFLLPILSTFAKENPPQLEEAMNLIKDNALKNHPPSSKKPPLFSDIAQHSIHYLAFLAEYELLFETALGMHDYDLARAVARNSQMDPKMYLPLLKRLRSLPVFYGRYEVDIRLKRYESALANLVESGSKEVLTDDMFDETSTLTPRTGNDFEDCLKLIEEHQLYNLGLKLFQGDTLSHRRIMLSLGEHLLQTKRADTALAVFSAADPPDLDNAKRAARVCGDWRSYFTLLNEHEDHETNMDNSSESAEIKVEKRRQLAREIADEIAAGTPSGLYQGKHNAFASAARILLDYGGDVVGAIDMYLSGEMWSEGRRVASLHSRRDLVKKCVDAAVSCAQTTIIDLQDRSSIFEKSNSRYAEVVKIRKQATVEDAPPVEEDETGSLFSAASNTSNMSLRSNASTSSTGSSNSVSSVISVRSTTSFTMTGDDEANRHRSKFNQGRRQKKPKKKKSKMQRGSEDELQSLIGALKAACVDSDYATTILETVQFLLIAHQVGLARELFEGYLSMSNAISLSQQKRIDATRNEKVEAERQSRKEGNLHDDNYILVELPGEQDVDALSCPPIPASLQYFFSFS